MTPGIKQLTFVAAAAFALGACSASATTATGPASTSAAVTSAPKATEPATPGPVQLRVIDTRYGRAIARGDGKVLYGWDTETGPEAKCVDVECVGKWPPLTATSISVGDGLDPTWFTLVPRPDGTTQVAVQGQRLYTMQIDDPGQVNCQDTEGWYIRNPDGTSNRTEVPGHDDDDGPSTT